MHRRIQLDLGLKYTSSVFFQSFSMHPRTQLDIVKSFLLLQGVPMPHVQSSCLENPRARFCEWLGKRTRVTVAKCKVGEFRDRQPVWSHMRQVPSEKC